MIEFVCNKQVQCYFYKYNIYINSYKNKFLLTLCVCDVLNILKVLKTYDLQ